MLILVWYCLPSTKPKVEKSQSYKSLFSNKDYLYTICIFGILALMQFGFRLLFTLICKSDESLGGMGISSEDKVSLIQGFAGIFVLVLPPLLTPVINMKIGLINSIAWICALLGPMYMVVYICRVLSGMWKYAALTIFYGVTNSGIAIFMFYISICVSNTVTSDILGAANGLSQAFVGMNRFISSNTFGIIYGWSVTSGLSYPLIDASFPYLLIVILSIIDLVLILVTLDSSVERKKVKSIAETPLLENPKVN